jgi:hypothetical protein
LGLEEMNKTRVVTDHNALRKELLKEYDRLAGHGGWRAVGEKYGISGGMAFRIAREGYDPADAEIRAKLGLAAYQLAPVCVVCGQVHLSRRHKHPAGGQAQGLPLQGKRLEDAPVELLKWALDNREEFLDPEIENEIKAWDAASDEDLIIQEEESDG